MKKVALLFLSILLPPTAQAQCWSVLQAMQYYSVGIRTNATLWHWGNNRYGQAGNNTKVSGSTPVQVLPGAAWHTVSGNFSHVAAIRQNRTLWTWGSNDDGQLGTGDLRERLVPTQIGTGTNWEQVSAGVGHTLALKTDGSLWAWGRNTLGSVGDGTAVDRPSPTRIGTGTAWTKVAAGVWASVALRSDGTLWQWGSALARVPVQVGTDTDWRDVSVGYEHIVGTKSNGSLWAWGFNLYGELGLGTSGPSTVLRPQQIGTATDWRFVSAGRYYTMAIKNNGSLWGWGSNREGQLGNNTTTNNQVTTPVRIGTATNWRVVNAGVNHTLAQQTTTDRLWAWGLNLYGELGDGSTTDQLSPIGIGICNALASVASVGRGDPEVQTFPNPATHYLHLKTWQAAQEIQVLDMTGRVVKEVEANQPTIDVQALSAGVYLLRIRTSEKVAVLKFSKL